MASYRHIFKGLTKAYQTAERLKLDPYKDRWILFSDHHRGRRDGADDFLVCEDTYVAALNHYLAEDYSLCLLGDVEEFWENSILSVVTNYKDLLLLEKKFYDKDKLYKIWGNHDDAWQFADDIRKHLGWLFPNIAIYESIILELQGDLIQDAEIFLLHGHQGSAESDRFSGISKWFVKYIWRNIQRLFKIPLSTPSNDLKLKSRHDNAFYNWSEQKKITTICGHTHQPVFLSLTHEEKIALELEELKEKLLDENIEEDLKLKFEKMVTKVENHLENNEHKTISKDPYYFNTGCCSFADGDITGIEIADGEIRLIKWELTSKKREILEETSIERLVKNR